MGEMREVIEAPLSGEELAARYRALCEDPRFDNLPGKIELDSWGRILMSPASNYQGVLQVRLSHALAVLGGPRAPELCIEIASPSNSVKELREKVEGCLGAGAVEAWIAYPQTKRFEFFTKSGEARASSYAVELSGLFG